MPSLYRTVRHVAAHERALDTAPHRLAADQHLVQRHFEHFVAAPEIHSDRISHRDEIDAGAVGDTRDLIVPGDDADTFLSVTLHLLKRGNSHLLSHASIAPVTTGVLARRRR